MLMPTLYIMSGLPFAGKSTLARKLAEYLGAELVSFDPTWVKHEAEIPDVKDGWRFIRGIAKKEIAEHLKNGRSVVYDDTNPRTEHREEFRVVVEEAGARAMTIFMDTPLEVVRSRMEANISDPRRHDVTEANLQTTVEQLQAPVGSEAHVVFRHMDDMEKWFLNNFKV